MASPIVKHVVEFNTLKTTFVPRIFESRDWAALFENFEDPMDELVIECYSNISDLGVELICWVRGKEFIINPNSIAKILHFTRPQNVNLTPYDNRTPKIQDILQVLGPDHEVSSKGTSISTIKKFNFGRPQKLNTQSVQSLTKFCLWCVQLASA